MAQREISWTGIFIRFCFALVIVFASYNPAGYSFYHWGIVQFQDFSVLKLLVAILLLIGWTIYIRATLNSLGGFGIFLATAFFATLLWLLVDWGVIPVDSVSVVTYLVLVVISALLATGMTWSHIRRRISGQFDVDEIEQ